MVGIRQEAAAQGATLAFLDESGLATTPLACHTWAPRGQTPCLRFPGSRTKASLISAITVRPEQAQRPALYLQFHPGKAIRSAEVIAFLQHLLRHVEGPLIVLWDRGGPHRSAQTRQFVADQPRIRSTHFLPGYAPALNPDEWVWSHLKKAQLANLCVKNLDELLVHGRRAVRRIQRRPTLLASFIAAAGLW